MKRPSFEFWSGVLRDELKNAKFKTGTEAGIRSSLNSFGPASSAAHKCVKMVHRDDLRRFVETAVAAAGGEYIVFAGEEAAAGTPLDKRSPTS